MEVELLEEEQLRQGVQDIGEESNGRHGARGQNQGRLTKNMVRSLNAIVS